MRWIGSWLLFIFDARNLSLKPNEQCEIVEKAAEWFNPTDDMCRRMNENSCTFLEPNLFLTTFISKSITTRSLNKQWCLFRLFLHWIIWYSHLTEQTPVDRSKLIWEMSYAWISLESCLMWFLNYSKSYSRLMAGRGQSTISHWPQHTLVALQAYAYCQHSSSLHIIYTKIRCAHRNHELFSFQNLRVRTKICVHSTCSPACHPCVHINK